MSAKNTFAGLSIGLVAMVFVMAACGAPSSGGGAAVGGSSEFKVAAKDFTFAPAELKFTAGGKVKITLANQGALDHTWILKDDSGKDLSPKLEAKVGQTKSIEFTAPAAGTYTAVCDVAGHKEQGMIAKVAIQ